MIHIIEQIFKLSSVVKVSALLFEMIDRSFDFLNNHFFQAKFIHTFLIPYNLIAGLFKHSFTKSYIIYSSEHLLEPTP